MSTDGADDSPEQRLARWTNTDAAIGIAAEADQLRAQLSTKVGELEDLRARLAQLANRVAQLEADNAELRHSAGRVPRTVLARRAYRRGRSAAAKRLPR